MEGPILLLAAEGEEAEAVLARMARTEKLEAPWPAFAGELGGHEVRLLESGIGKAAAGAVVGWAVARYAPSRAVWLGVAGSLNPALSTGDVLIADDAVQWDMDLTPLGREPGELDSGERFIPADPVLAGALHKSAQRLGHRHVRGRVASGDTFVADPEKARWIRDTFGADAVEMEGAAALWAAHKLGVPMALVRAVTDAADTAAPGAFETFLVEVSQKLAALVEDTLAHLDRVD
ncbi:5'-methylthioadenosine/adenosylhomocysteine nucleosidase [Deinococcota bacterium DY0809b]